MSTRHSACGCPACRAAAAPPLPVANRPGLRSISYRSGTHGDFLAAMIAGLSRDTSPRLHPIPPATTAPKPHEGRPALRGLRTRDSDDATIALLDAFAVTADILTFYTERLANEAYLGTAIERASLQELGALVAYRLARGAAAETVLAFSLEKPPAPLPPSMKDPGIAPPVLPTALTLPVGLRVQSIPGPGEQPQTFETVEQIEARPAWNALPVAQTVGWPVTAATKEAWLSGIGLGLAAGDVVLLTSHDATGEWDALQLTDVDPEPAAGRTRIAWSQALKASALPMLQSGAFEVFAMRRRLSLFGHNAPKFALKDPNASPPTYDTVDGLSDFRSAYSVAGVTFTTLDGSHPEVAVDSWLLLEWGGRTRYRVEKNTELSQQSWGLAGPVTALELAGPAWTNTIAPRYVTALAVSERLMLAEAPDTAALAGTALVVDGDATGMSKGREVILAGTDAAGAPVSETLHVEKVEAIGGAAGVRTRITVATAPANPPTHASAVVFGNAARATHGETVTQLLGSGDARQAFAAYRLQQSPLTFVRAETPRGTASSLEVRVDDVRWTEVPTTATAGPRDRVYETRDEPDGGISVVFGDGSNGARPSTGATNIRARHRKGIGAAGNVRKDQLGIALDRPLGLKGVTNPAPAVGGVDPESEADARRGIPIPVRTLGRTVSLLDYADFSLAFAGIGKAQVTVLPATGGRALIVVTVADAAGAAPPVEVVSRLERELIRWGDPLVELVAVPVRRVEFRISMKVDTDSDRERGVVLAALEKALRDGYGARARELGDHVSASKLVATAASVVGIVGVDLDLLHRAATPTLEKRLIAAPATSAVPVPLGAELLVLSPDPFPPLLEMP
ncbi:baseplate J/gp47 family protein [Microbacterium sp. SS28]|uniref:baseplate J/gp47 family protein n=1 Tax=Microbacterium sp. SS28 TaxID=2919948 RepID=UPI001FA94CEB|nr:baseplate J/gp47 family protein [Microbacterium sp. SS28]